MCNSQETLVQCVLLKIHGELEPTCVQLGRALSFIEILQDRNPVNLVFPVGNRTVKRES